MKTYFELWNVLWNWKREFSVKEFISIFPSPNPNKILHDLTKKGFLERINRGRYKVNSAREIFKRKVNIASAYDLVRKIGLKYAFTEKDAVLLWTKGGYQVDRFFGFYPIYLKVLKSDLKAWKKVLMLNGMRFYIKGTPLQETFFGVFYVLQPEKDFIAEKTDDFFVDTLNDTVEFCKKNIYQYEPALEMLNEMYGLGINARYREI